MKNVTMKMTNTKWYIAGGSLIAAGLCLYFFAIKEKKTETDKYGNKAKTKSKSNSSTKATGAVEISTTAQASAKIEPDWENPFDDDYADDVKKWISPKPLVILKNQFAQQYAKELFTAKKGILEDDDEQAVFNVFGKKVKDKVHVSNVSRAFSNLYKKDMYEYLKSFLNDSEMEKYVHAPVRNLVNYRVG
jgi:hypothetical protein